MVSDLHGTYSAGPEPEREEIAVSDARASLAELVNQAVYQQRRIRLTRHGKAVAALVPIEDLEVLEAIEDRVDLEAARAALADAGDASLPWDQAKRALGL